MAKVKPVPEGYHTVTPYLIVRGAAAAIDFYVAGLGAVERFRMAMPGGSIGHAELQIGDSVVMLADEFPEQGTTGAQALGGTPVMIHLYLPDVDAVVQRAVDAGARVVRPVEDQFYGDRSGQIEDPFGHRWNVATHVEDVAEDEMARRMAAAQSG